MARPPTSTYGFKRAATLVERRVRAAGEGRGFAQSRVLTHWEEIAGPDLAAISRPVEVSYARKGFGATLTVLTTGANAPLLEMRKEDLRARINAVYGYNAIARLRITQTAASGFFEGQVDFAHRKTQAPDPAADAQVRQQARAVAEGIGDESLRSALERLAANVISKDKARHRTARPAPGRSSEQGKETT